MFHTKIEEAVPCNIIGVCIDDVPPQNNAFNYLSIIKRFDVFGVAYRDRPIECIIFTANAIIKNHLGNIHVGYKPFLYCGTSRILCEFIKFIQRVDIFHGNKVIYDPEWIKENNAAIVEMRPLNPIVVEPFLEYNDLGCFFYKRWQSNNCSKS